MTRAGRQLALVLTLALISVALALWQWRHDAAQGVGTLLDEAPATVTRIALQFGSGPTEHYHRHNGHWWRIDGATVRADDGRLAELAQIAQAPALEWRAASDFEPSRIGLNPPAITLTLDDHVLAFGGLSPTGPQRYVRSGSRIALVPARFAPRPGITQAVRLP